VPCEHQLAGNDEEQGQRDHAQANVAGMATVDDWQIWSDNENDAAAVCE